MGMRMYWNLHEKGILYTIKIRNKSFCIRMQKVLIK